MNDTQPSDSVASMRYLNVSAIKTHALACSKKIRAGAFDRVGQSFVEGVQAEVERLVREINGKFQPPIHDVVKPDGDGRFVTGAFMDKTQEILDGAVARIVQARVQRHPSIGKTLK